MNRWTLNARAARRRRPRRLPRLGLAVLAVLLVTAHAVYWYVPRLRQASPGDGLPGRLLASADAEACLWIPYPHQNLGVLARSVEDPQGYLAAVAEVAGMEAPRLPGFGPFRVPPAREMVVATAPGGEGFVVAARIYPVLAVLSRLAGKLAANPWLAGGEVRMAEQPARVRWQGSLWIVESAAGAPRPAAAAMEGPPALGRLRLERSAGLVPAGSYRLRPGEAGWVVEGEDAGPSAPAAALASLDLAGAASADLVVLVLDAGALGDGALEGGAAESPSPGPEAPTAFSDGDGTPGAGPPGDGTRGAALFSHAGRLGLPGVAVFARAGARRWKLPGEGVISLFRDELPAGEAAGWRVVALERESLGQALALAPRLSHLRRGRRFALLVAPGPAHELAEGVASVLEEVPLVGRRQARRWRAWATLLAPLRPYQRLTLEVGEGEGSFRLELR